MVKIVPVESERIRIMVLAEDTLQQVVGKYFDQETATGSQTIGGPTDFDRACPDLRAVCGIIQSRRQRRIQWC